MEVVTICDCAGGVIAGVTIKAAKRRPYEQQFRCTKETKMTIDRRTFGLKRVFADGDFVIPHVHVKLQPEDLGLAIVELFRLEHGKIVDHWDVRQPIPETAASTNAMF